jgi:hypothetical protein
MHLFDKYSFAGTTGVVSINLSNVTVGATLRAERLVQLELMY